MASPIDEMPPEYSVVRPAQYLFRSATPAIGFLGGSIGRTSPARRNSIGPYCSEFETKCAQGDWCCNTGETCSFDTLNGAYLCCGASAGAAGCARVCAVGTFQCGSVCCTHGQTCFGGDTVSGYCAHVNQTQTQNPLVQPTAGRTTTALQNFATATRGAGASATGSNRDGSSSSESLNQDRGQESGGGISLGVQIGIGVAVPILVICIAAAAWFCFARCRRARSSKELPEKNVAGSLSSPDSSNPSPVVHNFPSLPRNAMIVQTPVQPFEFGQPRTPKTTLPPPVPETPAAESERGSAIHGSSRTTPIIAAPRLATPIDLLNAVAAKAGKGK
ncbi:hypothetical protein QBC34DRAFT_456239 [Podospora aff. communis PSN243]|uniref:Uncharacterized protein n=1 Tax=Podospora aff. communis PSN243 TaxID=3040156 RepID=A0AAV9FYP1_9PEZI|nr:hypothetical protein QBC34DRAFT_456239 [Podospora aff. communis PSN243]